MPDPATPLTAQDELQAVLNRFVIRGAAVAETIADRIEHATNAEIPALATNFDRVTQGVRRSILLIDHRARADITAVQTRIAARKRIYRDVTDAIAAERLAPERAEALRVELVERLESVELVPDLDVEITHRRIEDIIYDFQRDLGLANQPGIPKWPRRRPHDIADILSLARSSPKHPIDPPPRLAEH